MPCKSEIEKKAYHKEHSRKHYLKYKDRIIAANKRNRAVHKKTWDKFKTTLSCAQCGFSHSAALDFHHENPSEKEYNIHKLIGNGRFAQAYEEIKKCIVLCANCHRIHHWQEKKNPTG
jgi:hypothetical protein